MHWSNDVSASLATTCCTSAFCLRCTKAKVDFFEFFHSATLTVPRGPCAESWLGWPAIRDRLTTLSIQKHTLLETADEDVCWLSPKLGGAEAYESSPAMISVFSGATSFDGLLRPPNHDIAFSKNERVLNLSYSNPF